MNDLMLNDSWSVGDVATLVELKPFMHTEEWEAFYYRSGEEREVLISRWDAPTQATLQDTSLIKNDQSFVHGLNWNLKNLNTHFGRTRERLYQIAETVRNCAKDAQHDLSLEECFEYVRYEVIFKPWNDMVLRKQNTVKTLQGVYPQAEFRKMAGVMGHNYSVDYEAYLDGKLQYALQVKPTSYNGDATHIKHAQQANKRINQLYTARFGVPVYLVISDEKGEILHSEIPENL
ncbi:hypothetical protein MKJ04_11565 [Pontibacter sp. E15-1]|uniref:hypothetical protein n=1 Tax=Pontibacter sp. E15-1 TaxID=2919918 RepID=UPI001F4FAE5B|nr:hypothetical protein [Pontibacter sp. E15-1]MCJ8165481.1 hypothetical protein [Pontibacter sp. E15-1]